MRYFTEIADYETYQGEEADFHFNYNANTGGGQSRLGGKFYDANGNLSAPIQLKGRVAVFAFSISGNVIQMSDPSVEYEVKPRDAGNTNMKLGVGDNHNPSEAIAAFLMLPKPCGVKNACDINTSVLNGNNYWLQSMWLDVDTSIEGKAIFTPKDCIICGGIDKQGQGSARYFSIDFAKRFADVINAANNDQLDGEVLSCVKLFADIYKGEKPFVYDESVEAIKAVMKYLSSKYPEEYSGTLDPLMMIRELAHINIAPLQVQADVPSDILAAIRTKPFILLAGMSGTGKTRIVRQLARGCCPAGSDFAKDPDNPGNYECIPVRPNWHDSTGLMGYVSRIDGEKYVVTDFVRFLAKAWLYEEEGIPFFLCLDEMNLAPVEQYFAEYLSVVESRRVKGDKIITDPLVRIADEKLLKGLLNEVYPNHAGEVANLVKMFVDLRGIPIPSNFVVMGTVNMDETTCSFPRKVLDRAMTFELNEFDIDSGLESNPDTPLGSIKVENAKGTFTHGWQVYAAAQADCDKIKPYLVAVNAVLNGTPFKFAYRTRDEVMAYCVERMKDGTALVAALDEATSMKILSRVEGDEQIVKRTWLEKLQTAIADGLKALCAEGEEPPKKCADKLTQMHKRLVDTGFTSFWA